MTNRERWMTSDNPAWMLAALGDAADERRKLLWVDACRKENDTIDGEFRAASRWDTDARVKSWCKNHGYSLNMMARCDLIRCLWPSPFIGRERDICDQCEGKKTVETIARYYGWDEKRRGVSYEDSVCWACRGNGSIPIPLINPRWRTPLVMGLARQVRGVCKECGGDGKHYREVNYWGISIEKCKKCDGKGFITSQSNPELSPILSDALQDVWCEVPEIIEHLKRGVHVAGECWVIKMLLGES